MDQDNKDDLTETASEENFEELLSWSTVEPAHLMRISRLGVRYSLGKNG
jgi:3-methyladenine DNA glycosylase AlkC